MTKDAMKKYRKKHGQSKIEQYMFLHSCEAQCVHCALRCVKELRIDPETCKSWDMDGLAWARSGNRPVSEDFLNFWMDLTSRT